MERVVWYYNLSEAKSKTNKDSSIHIINTETENNIRYLILNYEAKN
jgi:hypothetical protein